MKRHVFVLIIFCFVQTGLGQGGPLTQAEYVKMLYGLQKDPGGKADIVEALRKRGIDFVATDGLRDLTRSKGANDEELKRALDEAGRRKENPVAAKLPSAKEATDVLENTRKNTLEAVEAMPDFVVKQQIQRLLGDMDLVGREEFEAVKAMAANARAEQEAMTKRLAELEGAAAKPAAKAKRSGDDAAD